MLDRRRSAVARRRFQRAPLFAWAAFAASCTSTPIDAIHRGEGGSTSGGAGSGSGGEDFGGSAGSSGSAGAVAEAGAGGSDGPSCPIEERTYSIRARSSGFCLHAGAATTLMGVPVQPEVPPYLVEANGECTRTEWLLQPSNATQFAYQVKSQELADYNLDIETGSSASGTRAILYTAPPFGVNPNHQRFFFVPRATGVFAIQPVHVMDMCLTDAPAGVQIRACDELDATQDWELLSSECLDTE